jgi:hypothetical protein
MAKSVRCRRARPRPTRHHRCTERAGRTPSSALASGCETGPGAGSRHTHQPPLGKCCVRAGCCMGGSRNDVRPLYGHARRSRRPMAIPNEIHFLVTAPRCIAGLACSGLGGRTGNNSSSFPCCGVLSRMDWESDRVVMHAAPRASEAFWGVWCDERRPALQMAQQIATRRFGSDRSGRPKPPLGGSGYRCLWRYCMGVKPDHRLNARTSGAGSA